MLTAEAWREWADELAERLGDGAGAAALAAALTESLASRRLLCDLFGQTPANLEHNVSLEAVRVYRLAINPIVAELSERFTRTHPGLGSAGGYELVAATVMLAAQLHQITNPPAVLAELYATDPNSAGPCPEFEPLLGALLLRFLESGAP